METEYCLLQPNMVRLALIQLQKLPFSDVRILVEEMEYALCNPITFNQSEEKKPQQPIGFKTYNQININDNDNDE